jgi:hypothetical protein
MPDRMIGLSPATKIRYQQQTNSQKSSTTIQSESTKPAIAIIRPSMNTQTHHHPQQPQVKRNMQKNESFSRNCAYFAAAYRPGTNQFGNITTTKY